MTFFIQLRDSNKKRHVSEMDSHSFQQEDDWFQDRNEGFERQKNKSSSN